MWRIEIPKKKDIQKLALQSFTIYTETLTEVVRPLEKEPRDPNTYHLSMKDVITSPLGNSGIIA